MSMLLATASGAAVTTALKLASEAPKILQENRGGSLVEYTKSTRIEPITLIDSRTAQLPYTEDILNNTLNIFSAFYLMAFSLDNISVNGVQVRRSLDKLNPNRDPLDSALSGRLLESVGKGLSLESNRFYFPNDMEIYQTPVSHSMESASDSIKDVRQSANLAVGKLLEVELGTNESRMKFPIMIRLMTQVVQARIMVDTIARISTKMTMAQRWHQWRSGQISLVKDLLLCRDLIDQHKKNLVEDDSGLYRSTLSRKRQNQLSSILSGTASIGQISSIHVITEETRKEVERELRGKLSNFKVRQDYFKETSAMILVVIDPEWEIVQFYYHSIESVTEVSVREIQRSMRGKQGGPDIVELLNALRQSNAPSF